MAKSRPKTVKIRIREFMTPADVSIGAAMFICRLIESIHNGTDPKDIELPYIFTKLEED